MTVLVNERKEGELLFLTNAKSLQIMTEQIVMNDKYVPKKYRICWSQHVVKLSMDIFCYVRKGNGIYPTTKEQLKRRLSFLSCAEECTNALLSQIDIAKTVHTEIKEKTIIEWEKLCASTKRNITSRIKADIDRFKNLP